MESNNLVSARGLTKTFDGRRAVDGIDHVGPATRDRFSIPASRQ